MLKGFFFHAHSSKVHGRIRNLQCIWRALIHSRTSTQISRFSSIYVNPKAWIKSLYNLNHQSIQTRYKLHLTAGEWNESYKRSEASKQHWKDPFVSLRHFNWLWTNYVILSQVAAADGLVQWPVSIRGQGGLLLGMDAPLLGSLPAWVPSCLLLPLLGRTGLTRLWGFKLGSNMLLDRGAPRLIEARGKHTHTRNVVTTNI